ncbi:MAG: TIGR01621 family pseudouridine synthase [Sulfurimonas sp.]|nr:TIGR01621 family pseudouridine synthase [Sulfurimonas sp.]MBU3939504.1 TIGR01621 family pseudouridine synthase [bacterium]MBU4024767.1 TIGR01621 family pseudouridine synthase [bacterium]MBU4059880.1 TIGR01621 family pseudouridine synthase [bacterium]MBU4111397.1 TIGR01621 family pseudouridine synthase [bacterium]
MNIEIIFQNSDFAIFDKPSRMSFHSEDGAGFVVQATELLNAEQLFSVHRLDKMTSGLIILAKSSEVANKLSKLFETRQIEKFYLAVSLRKPKKKQGWIKADMAQARRGSYKLVSTMENPAITQFVSCALRVHERLFLIKPHTGKTHQIRVALKSLGSPIAGDERYAFSEDALKEERGYLHAYALRFVYNEQEYSFICNPTFGERFLNATCEDALTHYGSPWNFFK